MSYCRFSSDDWRSDVYVYEDCLGGWTTHVAAQKVVFKQPLPPPADPSDTKAEAARFLKVFEMRKEADLVPIGLPHDGRTFHDPSPGACADRLVELREMGYNVPDGVIEVLREEHEEWLKQGDV